MTYPESLGSSHDPLPGNGLPSPVSRLGPGFRRAVKPDILAAGGRLRATLHMTASPARLRFGGANRYGGLRVAGPTAGQTAWSGATSGAAALMTRAAHRIHVALEEAYGELFTSVDRTRRSLIVKALLVHRSAVLPAARHTVEGVFGPADPKLWQQRNAHVQRLFGYGIPAIDEALACIQNRATLWGHGVLGVNEARVFRVPLPDCIFGNRIHRSISATVAWYTPVLPGRQQYKAVRLIIEEPDGLDTVGVAPTSGQVGQYAAARGTLFHRSWSGSKLKNVLHDGVVELNVSRMPDPADDLPDAIPFGFALSIEADDPELPIYEQVRTRLAVRPRIAVPIAP
jgi:hypothetical protein